MQYLLIPLVCRALLQEYAQGLEDMRLTCDFLVDPKLSLSESDVNKVSALRDAIDVQMVDSERKVKGVVIRQGKSFSFLTCFFKILCFSLCVFV